MAERRRDYDREECEIRGAWHASPGATTEEAIKLAAQCRPPVAFRIALLRRAGSLRLLTLWLDGVITLRQTERICIGAPFNEADQLERAGLVAAARPALARG